MKKLLLMTLVLCSFSTSALADDDFRLGVFAGAHFGGEAKVKSDSGSLLLKDPTPFSTFGIRGEYAILDVLSIGAQISHSSSDLLSDGISYTDFDLLIKGSYPIKLKAFTLRPYAALPVGYSLSKVNFGNESESMHGAHASFVVGSEFQFGSFAPFVEFGSDVHLHEKNGLETELIQVALRAGASYVF